MCQRFYPYPFGEIIDSDDEKLLLTYYQNKWAKYIHFPLDEGPKSRELGQLAGKLSLDTGIVLVLVALPNKLHNIFSHGRSVIPILKFCRPGTYLPDDSHSFLHGFLKELVGLSRS